MTSSRILVAAACFVGAAEENVAVDMSAVVLGTPTAGVAPGCRVSDIVCARLSDLEKCNSDKGVTVSTAREGNWLDAQDPTVRGQQFVEYCREAVVDTLEGLSEHGGNAGAFCPKKKWKNSLGRSNSLVALCSLPAQFKLVYDTTSDEVQKARPLPSKKGERCSVKMLDACDSEALTCLRPEGHHAGNAKGLCAPTASDVSISPDGALLYASVHPLLPEGFMEYVPERGTADAVAGRRQRFGRKHFGRGRLSKLTTDERAQYRRRAAGQESEKQNKNVARGERQPHNKARLDEVAGEDGASNTAASEESDEKSHVVEKVADDGLTAVRTSQSPFGGAGGDDDFVVEHPKAGGQGNKGKRKGSSMHTLPKVGKNKLAFRRKKALTETTKPPKKWLSRLRGTTSEREQILLSELENIFAGFKSRDDKVQLAVKKELIKAATDKRKKLLGFRNKFDNLGVQVPAQLTTMLGNLEDQLARLRGHPPLDVLPEEGGGILGVSE